MRGFYSSQAYSRTFWTPGGIVTSVSSYSFYHSVLSAFFISYTRQRRIALVNWRFQGRRMVGAPEMSTKNLYKEIWHFCHRWSSSSLLLRRADDDNWDARHSHHAVTAQLSNFTIMIWHIRGFAHHHNPQDIRRCSRRRPGAESYPCGSNSRTMQV